MPCAENKRADAIKTRDKVDRINVSQFREHWKSKKQGGEQGEADRCLYSCARHAKRRLRDVHRHF
jgi:hypothetical protein